MLNRRSFVRAVPAFLGSSASLGAVAATTPTYGVLSLAGEPLTAVRYQPSIGSNLDRNEKREIPVSGMDAALAKAVADSIARAQTGASAVPFQTTDTRLSGIDDAKRITDILRSDLDKMAATHLLVLTKVRHPTRLKVGNGAIGAGKLAGLGFYEDHAEHSNAYGGVLAHGFFATYVYAKASLVDLASNQVRETHVIESQMWSALAVPGNLDPWTVLSPQARLEDLRSLAQHALSEAAVRLITT